MAAALAVVGGLLPLALAIVAVIVLNGVLAFAQELQAERATEALRALLPPHSRVRRDGHEFDGRLKRMTTVDRGDGGALWVHTKGARLELLARCTTVRGRDGAPAMTDADRGAVQAAFERYAGAGLRCSGSPSGRSPRRSTTARARSRSARLRRRDHLRAAAPGHLPHRRARLARAGDPGLLPRARVGLGRAAASRAPAPGGREAVTYRGAEVR